MKQILSISQILLYYDLPQVMVVVDVIGTKYIAILTNSDEETCDYVCTPISVSRLSDFIRGDIDLLELFARPEISQFYTFDYNNESVEATMLDVDSLSSEFLPDAGVFLAKKQDDQDIIREVFEKNNAVVHLALSDADNSNSILAEDLGEILKYYQQVIENGYKKSISQIKPDTKRAYNVPNNYKLRAFASSPGSFNIHLFSTSDIDLFGGTKIQDTLSKFDELLDENYSDETLMLIYKSVKGHTVSSLKNLFNKVIQLNIEIKHKWYAPNQIEVHTSVLDSAKALRFNKLLNSTDELGQETKVLTGYFEQLDVDSGSWRMFNLEDEKDYSGTTHFLNILQGVTIDRQVIYRLECIETIKEVKVSEKERISFELNNLYLMNSEDDTKINSSDITEIEFAAIHWGVTVAAVMEAIKKVGSSKADIETYLKK